MISLTFPVLLVEDSDDDVILFRRTWRKAGATAPLYHVDDGRQAIEYLAGGGAYADRTRFPVPKLVLLDLKLPLKSGDEVLQWARTFPGCDAVCIVILTSSAEPFDVQGAFRHGANAYFTKAISTETLADLLNTVATDWSGTNPRQVLDVRGSLTPPPPGQPPSAPREGP